MLVIAIFFLLLVVIFAVQNAQVVPLTFLRWSLETNQALVVLGSASIGVVIGIIWVWAKSLPAKGKMRELLKELDSCRKKIEDLERPRKDGAQTDIGKVEI